MKEFVTIIREWFPKLLEVFLGGYDNLLYSLVIVTLIDFLTEIMCSIIKKKRSKRLSVKGMCQIVTIFLMIGIANTLDVYIISNHNLLRTISIYYYISIEGKILLKNIKKITPYTPPKIKEVFKQIKKKSKSTEKTDVKIKKKSKSTEKTDVKIKKKSKSTEKTGVKK